MNSHTASAVAGLPTEPPRRTEGRAVAGLPTEPPGRTEGLPPIPKTFGPPPAGSETRAERASAGSETRAERARVLWPRRAALLLVLLTVPGLASAAQVVDVNDDASLRTALREARPGATIKIAPGRYRPGIYAARLRGTAAEPIVIEGADPARPPSFEGGSEAWHLSDCEFVTLRNIAVRGQSSNGINVDDGGTPDTPAHHIVLENVRVAEVGPTGNHDGIKLSGLDDFVIRGSVVEGWGGQAVDMVGCHRGRIEDCTFKGREGFSQSSGPQTKGGSSQIVIRHCRFLDAGGRAVNLGGSTGMAYFRPKGALYEAKDIRVEGCTFVGSQAPVAFVGVDGAVVRYNTFYRPTKWVLRILQETTAPGFAPCRNGRFEHNLVVFRRSEVQTFVNIGPHTRPETFTFAENLWYCEDRPAASKPQLPTAETGGLYGLDPKLTAPEKRQFHPKAPKAAAFGATALPEEP